MLGIIVSLCLVSVIYISILSFEPDSPLFTDTETTTDTTTETTTEDTAVTVTNSYGTIYTYENDILTTVISGYGFTHFFTWEGDTLTIVTKDTDTGTITYTWILTEAVIHNPDYYGYIRINGECITTISQSGASNDYYNCYLVMYDSGTILKFSS